MTRSKILDCRIASFFIKNLYATSVVNVGIIHNSLDVGVSAHSILIQLFASHSTQESETKVEYVGYTFLPRVVAA